MQLCLFDQGVPFTLESNPYKIFFYPKYSDLSVFQFCFHSFSNGSSIVFFIATMRIIHLLCSELDKAKYAWKIGYLFESLNKRFGRCKCVCLLPQSHGCGCSNEVTA